MSERALLVGGGGFVGRALASLLSSEGVSVVGTGRDAPPSGWRDEWLTMDVRDRAAVGEGVRVTAPDLVFHLAAATGDDLSRLLDVNVAGTQNVLDAIADNVDDARVVIAGSAAEYGWADEEDLPLTETSPLRPVTLYGVSKVAQTLVATRHARARGTHVAVARTFNVTGPGEPPTLAFGSFASQIAEFERAGDRGVLKVGNLDSERDFVDVRDVASALARVARDGRPAEVYNVCSGEATRLRSAVELLRAKARVPVDVQHDPGRAQPADVPRQIGSPEKLRRETGWAPSFSLDESLAALLDSWR